MERPFEDVKISWRLVARSFSQETFRDLRKAVTMTTPETPHDDIWSIAEGDALGKPRYIRFRTELQQKSADPAYPRLIQIVWKYEADENGLPSLETATDLRAFEDKLRSSVESEKIGLLVAVCTNNGEREWMFYTSGVSDFERCLNEMQDEQDEQDEFPIDVTSAKDPKWSAFFEETLGSFES